MTLLGIIAAVALRGWLRRLDDRRWTRTPPEYFDRFVNPDRPRYEWGEGHIPQGFGLLGPDHDSGQRRGARR